MVIKILSNGSCISALLTIFAKLKHVSKKHTFYIVIFT